MSLDTPDYADDLQGQWWAEIGWKEQLYRSTIKELVRMAYEGEPELAGDIARQKGEYGEFLAHMLKVHRKLIHKYGADKPIGVMK